MAQKFILIVDDLRLFEDHEGLPLVYAVNSGEALDILKRDFENVREVWLDHDLGMVNGKLDDVTPVINWLEEKSFYSEHRHVSCIRILTNNPVGAQKISALSRYYNIGPTIQHTSLRQVHSEE